MNLSTTADITGIISFVITIATFFTALNVRSKIIHYKEREHFKKEIKLIEGKLSGYRLSIVENHLSNSTFYLDIDTYMTDLITRYSFLNIPVKLRCKYISYLVFKKRSHQNFERKLVRQFTYLINALLKENEL